MATEDLVSFLSTVELLSVLEPADLEVLAAGSESRTFDFGDNILSAGDEASGFYIVRKGAVRLFTAEGGKETSQGLRKVGEVVGEIAVLRDYRHEVSVRSSGKTELVYIPRALIASILEKNPEAARFVSGYVAIHAAGGVVTRLFDLKRKVDPKELEEMVRSVGVKRLRAGREILEQGNRDDHRLYVVRQGSVQVMRKEGDEEYPIATLGQGETFGEKAALEKDEQPYTIVAQTDVVLLVIPQETMKFVLERNPKLKEVLQQRIDYQARELQRQKKLAERRSRPILLDLISKPKAGEKLIRRFPLVEQAEEMDCGAACLAMICKHYHIPMTLGKLREMANVTTEGATLDSLARVGESLGFTTRGVRCTYQSLLGFDLPFIAHWEGYHYIIVYGVSKNQVWVADPALGFRKLDRDEFEKGWNGTCLLFTPGSNMIQQTASRSPWVRFVGYLRPYKKLLGHLLLATLVIEVLGIVPPIIVQNVLDRVVVHTNVSLLNVLMVGLVLAHVFTQLATLLRAFLSNYIVRNLDFSMMTHFFKHAMSLPMKFFATRRTGDIFARFQENATIREFLTESTVSTFLNVLMMFLYFIVLFLYNTTMTLLLIAMIVPVVVLTVAITPRIKYYARKEFETSTDAEAVLMETLGAVETIKGMGIERSMRIKWEKKYAKSLDVQYRSQRFDAFIGMASQLLNAATTIVILWVGANLVLSQQLTIGQLIAFNMLMGSVMSPIMGLVGLWDELHEAGVAMERLGDVLDLDPEQKPEDLASRIVLPDLRGDIRFDNVYFRYGGSETGYVLENISFEMKAGEMIAIVGHSGSGKTTLAKLLVGFYPPSEGKISVDGYDITLLDAEYYRSQIGYVMQSNLLFSGTLAENIAIGDENPDRLRIVQAAKQADAHAFISKMPLGYEQVVGERGMGLSGGQIQRLCIARALYREPRLLIFDEATSALDTQSEGNILKNMHDILQGRTAVVIAHRLSTIMGADKILVLYDGAIVEEGTHPELVERRGMYYQLVRKQLSGDQ